MQIIISHVNTDFDALASMFAAKKLYPDAKVVISDKQTILVKQFLTIYRDTLDLVQDKLVDWSEVTELILVDVASLSRIGNYASQLNLENVNVIVYDHHPRTTENVKADFEVIEQVGSTVTLLIEEIGKRNIPISSFEATLFGLGIYSDTGSFTYQNTTLRDFKAAGFLMEQGMDLQMINRFTDYVLQPEQQALLNQLFLNMKIYEIDGLEMVVSACETEKFLPGLASITEKLQDLVGSDATLTIVKMKKHTYIVGRGDVDRVNLLPLLKKYGGGGHAQAGSATVKKGDFDQIVEEVTEQLELILEPPITARDMMTSPVKTLLPETKIEEAGRLMYRYSHSGYPVVKDNRLVGMITRRDLDKANHHGLGHAPVKAYMSTNVITIEPDTTMEKMQKLIIEHNIGRLPVMEDGKLIGIVTRTNLIEFLYNPKAQENAEPSLVENLQVAMEKQLPTEVYSLLLDISKTASEADVSVYLIGGIVRDLFLEQPNDDVDIVVEGDGIAFAEQLQREYGGEVTVHENFGTATWEHPSTLKVDITSARLEYYDRPAALPNVETSSLQEDLYRRDFTINAMAVRLNADEFGEVVDPFHGQADLRDKKIKALHNLSFVEDPTRILRAVRFETRFDFLMDEQTEKLALHSIAEMRNLSADRINNEMMQLFQEASPTKIIRRLFELMFWQQYGVAGASLEASCTHAKKVARHFTNQKGNGFYYFTIPFWVSGNIEKVKPFALKKQEIKFLQDLEGLAKKDEWKQTKNLGDYHRFLKHHTDEAILFFSLIEDIEKPDIVISYLKKRQQLAVYLTGEDLKKNGMQPGPAFSKILLELEVAVLNEEIKSREEALLWLQESVKQRDGLTLH